jgi:hypothetical protein
MTCSRLSRGALALTLAASLAGLVIACGALAVAADHAASARQKLHSSVSAGLSQQHQPMTARGQAS